MSTDCRIHVLPDLLINKIAAGEVVERPASVAKELIENAIDAGATRIAVTIEEGGRQLIRVTDDGSGMTREELRLAVAPHATSKITVEDDLYAIATMGFRGEALASISAVAKLRIVSRHRDGVEGHEVRLAAARFESARAAGCPPGTTVEVRDLFFNVPARRKFLRARSTEVGHVNEQLARTALAHPRIGFELTNNGRVTQNLPPCGGRLERIGKFYGLELASDLMHIQRSERGFTLEAYVATPVHSRATTQWQYTFVNGRYIRDRYVQHALKEAYRGLTEPNRHGVVFLFLTVDPSTVDVNVHPTKIEVRWADSNLIHSQVLSAIRETFQRCDLSPRLRTDRDPSRGLEPARTPRGLTPPAEQDRIRHEATAALKAAVPLQPAPRGEAADHGSHGIPTRAAGCSPLREASRVSPRDATDGRDSLGAPPPAPIDPQQMWQSLYSAPPSPSPADASSDSPVSAAATHPMPATQSPSRPHAVQMHNLYLVAETEDGIVIVDQHALHERIMYEQLRERITQGTLESQRLLLPETLNVTGQQASLLESNAELLARLGVEVTPFGTDAVAVHAFPALLKDTDVVLFMRDLLDQLTACARSPDPEQVIHKILDMMACKAAVKAGDPLTPEEIDALMRQRHLIEKASSCPHGRPTMLRLTKADLDRQFKRT